MQAAVAARRSWQTINGAAEALRRLSECYTLHVLANWDKGLEQLLEATGLRASFTAVWSSEQLGAEKPESEAFSRFLTHTRLDARQVVYVGNDYEPDVHGSRRAGLTPVLLDHAGRYGESVDCRRVTSFDGLCALLLVPGGVCTENIELAEGAGRGQHG
jgi:FMN phosphatase YigB (HAD superfamily)